MMYAKRLLALLLALALAIGMVVFAAGETDEAADEAMPVITQQPKSVKLIVYREPLPPVTLTVEAHIPDGGEVGYQWYENDGYENSEYTKCKNGENAAYTTDYNEDIGGDNSKSRTKKYYCVVYRLDEGPDGPNRVVSNTVTVTWKGPWWTVGMEMWLVLVFPPFALILIPWLFLCLTITSIHQKTRNEWYKVV